MLKFTLAAMLVCGTLTSARAGTILSFDFNSDKNPWPAPVTDVMPSTPLPIEPAIEAKPVGTIDVAGTATPSGGLLMSTSVGDVAGPWTVHFYSGQLDVKNAETNLAKLTLAFDLSVSTARPVIVRVESFDAARKRTGGLQTTIYPAAPDFQQRYAIDLGTMKPAGTGAFAATDPFVQISFDISGPAWPSGATHELRLDNVHYASPAYYVSPKGSDDNDGLTEATPFLHPQKAVDLAKPGDIVLLMGGEYRRGGGNDDQDGIMHIESAGTPAAWMTFKNYPGQTPTFINEDCWNSVRIGGRVRLQKFAETPPAYIEIRGLHVRGQADKVMEKYRADIGLPKPTTNGNGIGGGGVRGGVPPHHLRVADCVVEYCPGGGIGFGDADRLAYENNVARYNSWFTIYATSGMGTIGTENFDSADNVYKILFRNNRVSWNRTYIEWKQIKKLSDGNGIIVDVNHEPAKGESYLGRTLIQNNVATYNGGSGIHAYKAHRVDIVNNTVFMNAATPELRWGQLFMNRVEDARIFNNVVWARDGLPVNSTGFDTSDRGNTNISRFNNLYFGGAISPIMGTDDRIADPLFVDAWRTTWEQPDMRNFRFAAKSPGLRAGKWEAITPLTDIDGHPRPLGEAPDIGAFHHDAAADQ